MICDDCIHNAVCDRLCGENHCGYKHTKADIINSELEKIKIEITRWCNGYLQEEIGKDMNKIIDNHIVEL